MRTAALFPLVLFGVVLPGSVLGFDVTDTPPVPSASRPHFLVGAASRMGSEGAEVLLAFRVPYDELSFVSIPEAPDSQIAQFDLTMVLNEGSRQVGGDLWHEQVRATTAQSQSRDQYFERIIMLPVDPGKLRASVSMHERRTGRGSRAEWQLQVPDYQDEPISISSLWPARCETEFERAPSFPPSGWLLDPRFGESLDDICVMGEVYRERGEDPVELEWRILDVRQATLESHEMQLAGGRRIPFSLHLDLSRLWLGTYFLEVEVNSGRYRARRRFEFQMDETMVSPDLHLEQSLELLRIIATKEEIERIEELPEGERIAGWNAFWEKKDPTPGTEQNEFRDVFFERVRYANERFGVLEPGWKSDRGRVYIRYGPPDEIQSRPSTIDGLAFEVWNYLATGRRFVFVDYDGFGRFELYQPGRPR